MSVLDDPDRARRVGLALAAASAVAVVIGVVLFVSSGARFIHSFMLQNGALGWTMVLFASHVLLSGVYTYLVSQLLGRDVVRNGLLSLPEALPTALVALRVITDIIPMPAVYLVIIALMVFPDGRLLSHRWRPLVGLFVVTLTTEMTWLGMQSARADGLTANHRDVPLDWSGTLGTVVELLGLAWAVGLVFVIAGVVIRYRRASGVERAQIRWVWRSCGTACTTSMW
jgi:two-component system, NarL family, sensor kinase